MTMGLWERFDIVEWAQYLAKRCPSCKLVLHGCSMGAATVLYASALALPREVCCCVADCGYTSPGEAFLQELTRLKRDPEWGPVYGVLAEGQTRQCRILLELLGTL